MIIVTRKPNNLWELDKGTDYAMGRHITPDAPYLW